MAISRAEAAEYYRGVEKETICCPVCQSDQYEEVFDRDRLGMGVKTACCLKCGLIYINPRPTTEAMSRFYRDHYRDFYEAIEVPTQEYIEQGPFLDRANFVLAKLRAYSDQGFSRALDIGCSEGTFLKRFGQEFPGSEYYGLEPDPNFAEFARQHSGAAKVHNCDFQEFFSGNTMTFDLVTLSHVLEHLMNPLEDLKSIRELMRDDGFFYVEVPNVMHPDVKGIANIHLGHVLSFSPYSLKSLLKLAGFELVEFFDEGLPAKTKAMAAICTTANRNDGERDLDWPQRDEIERWTADYKNRCCPPRKKRSN